MHEGVVNYWLHVSVLLCVIVCDRDTVKGELCHCVNVTESDDMSAVSKGTYCIHVEGGSLSCVTNDSLVVVVIVSSDDDVYFTVNIVYLTLMFTVSVPEI